MFRFYRTYKETFYSWLRKRTRPLSIEEAEEKKLFWARAYLASCISLMGVLLVGSYKNDVSSKKSFTERIANTWGVKKGEPLRVITIQGFKKVSDVGYTEQEVEELLNKAVPEGLTNSTADKVL